MFTRHVVVVENEIAAVAAPDDVHALVVTKAQSLPEVRPFDDDDDRHRVVREEPLRAAEGELPRADRAG